jgi:hypothetical protein
MERDEDIIRKKELSLVEPEVRRSKEQLASLLADSFIEIGSTGSIYNKKDTVETLPNLGTVYRVEDLEVTTLSEDIIQTVFKTTQTKTDGTVTKSLRSSIWKKIDSEWRMIFHQGTPTN